MSQSLAAARKAKEDELRKKRELARQYLGANQCGPIDMKKSVAEKVGLENTMELYRREKAKQLENAKNDKVKVSVPVRVTMPPPPPATPATPVLQIPQGWEMIQSVDEVGSIARAFRHCSTGCLTSQHPKASVPGPMNDDRPLVPGWKAIMHVNKDRLYYWHPLTGKVSWTRPEFDITPSQPVPTADSSIDHVVKTKDSAAQSESDAKDQTVTATEPPSGIIKTEPTTTINENPIVNQTQVPLFRKKAIKKRVKIVQR